MPRSPTKQKLKRLSEQIGAELIEYFKDKDITGLQQTILAGYDTIAALPAGAARDKLTALNKLGEWQGMWASPESGAQDWMVLMKELVKPSTTQEATTADEEDIAGVHLTQWEAQKN